MAAKHSISKVDPSDIVELLVHVPPRGKRAAIVTMRTETGPHQIRVELSETMITDIIRILMSSRSSGVLME